MLFAGSIGAPMSGEVIEVKVMLGSQVRTGQTLVVMKSHKKEIVVTSPVRGEVLAVYVQPKAKVCNSFILCVQL